VRSKLSYDSFSLADLRFSLRERFGPTWSEHSHYVEPSTSGTSPSENDMNNQLLDVLTRAGVLINVSVRYWRGCKKLRPEDLGLKKSQVSNRLISLGHKRLLPKEALADLALIEGRAHALIDQHTFPFLNGLGHFLPNACLDEVVTTLKALESDFWNAKRVFMDHYATHRDEALKEWEREAGKITSRVNPFMVAIESSFPITHALEKQFGFTWTLFQISLPESYGVDAVEFEDQQTVAAARRVAAAEAGRKIREETEQFVVDCVASLREQTSILCDEMLQSIRTSETGVHQKTLNRLVRFIDQFKSMNFVDDQVMEQQLSTVRRELLSRTAEEYRDSRSARQRLVQGLTSLSNHARELAQADASALVSRFGELGRRKFSLAA
jgi:hypothetical protein